jgi:subtilisin family serine protease
VPRACTISPRVTARSLFLLSATALTLLFAAPSAFASEVVPGELIVGFSNDTSRAESREIAKDADVVIDQRIPGTDAALVSFENGQTIGQATSALESQDGVSYVEPNFVVRRATWTNDPLLNNGTLWGILKIKAPSAWATTTGTGAIVAVLDSGIALTNPELIPNLWQNNGDPANGADDDGDGFIDDTHGADWVRGDGTPDDEEGHGTHVAGTIAAAANDGNGVVGVAPGAQVMALKFLDNQGAGSVADAISAIDFAIHHGASVINASWGGPDYSHALEAAMRRANDAGVVIATAAGNEHANNDSVASYPANFDLPNVISVGAIDSRGKLANFSNYGARSVDIAAPGVNIASTVGDHYESWSGTSMAAPHVAGVAALLKSIAPASNAASIADAINSSASASPYLTGKIRTSGVLNTVGAINALGQPGVALGNATAPSPFRLRKPGHRVIQRRGKVKFSWSRSFDDDLVGYEIYIDGKLKSVVEDPDGASGPATARTSAKVKIKAGRHNWRVVAVDEAGNERIASRGQSRGRVAVISSKHRRR